VSSLEELGEVISTDLLIVGGGLAGLAAAIKAKENPVDVLVVDKETIGWSGKAPKTGGIAWLVAPEDDLDKSVEEQIKRTYGDYLNDQELLYAYSRESYAAVEQFAEWGVKFTKTAEGKLDTYKPYPFPRTCSYADFEVDMLFPLRAKARKMGTKMLNKIELLDLLKQDDRVVGAVGFNVINGRFYILKAKATILANGSCDFMATRDGPAAGGEGIAAAYWAGAEMRNAEFGNLYVVHVKASDSYVRGAPINYIFNAQGENISKRYIPDEMEDNIALVLGIDKEIREGRGPIDRKSTRLNSSH
jgi:succinate dehydrogenase/fumarate reductase flavoprotein subunit